MVWQPRKRVTRRKGARWEKNMRDPDAYKAIHADSADFAMAYWFGWYAFSPTRPSMANNYSG